METIKTYLANMFASLPKTKEFINLRDEILANMEEKYNELKADGKSENEAVGIVISEFGNIDELIQEMGLDLNSNANTSSVRIIDQPEANEIIKTFKKYNFIIAIGVVLCILAPAILVFFSGLTNSVDENVLNIIVKTGLKNNSKDLTSALILIPFFIMIAIAVALFISSGMMLSKYEYLEKESFNISLSTKSFLSQKKDSYQGTFALGITLGVVLCILSPVSLITIAALSDNNNGSYIGVSVLLVLIAIAVFIFIVVGSQMDIYKKLLQEEEYSKKAKEDNRVIGAVAAIIWPLATAFYLLWSFISGDWHITWIVWPIVGICFGAFSGSYSILHDNKYK